MKPFKHFAARFGLLVLVPVLQVDGVINGGTARYIGRGLDLAASQHAPLVVLRLNTPGGMLSSTREIVQKIDASPVPVAVYVAPAGASATSAGTIITMAAQVAAMAPGTNIGAAHPVGSQGEDIKGAMKLKAENDTVAFIRAQAALRGRNAEWAEQAIRKSVSAAADEAVAKHVVDFIAKDVVELLQHRGLSEPEPKDVPMTLAERFLSFIGDPNISYMLMTFGGLGIYIELTATGAILPGVCGVILLILAFISFSTLPVNYGGVALLLLGFALFVADAFVTSHGVVTIGGVVSILLGALFLMDSSAGDLRLSLALVLPSALALGGITLFLGIVAYRTRKTVYGGLTSFADFPGHVQSLDATGHSGKCQVRGELWDFDLSDSTKTLHVGDQITVVERRGMKLLVK